MRAMYDSHDIADESQVRFEGPSMKSMLSYTATKMDWTCIIVLPLNAYLQPRCKVAL